MGRGRRSSFDDILQACMTASQRVEYEKRIKKGYAPHKLWQSRKTGRFIFTMHLDDKGGLGYFITAIYPDGKLVGGKTSNIKVPLPADF